MRRTTLVLLAFVIGTVSAAVTGSLAMQYRNDAWHYTVTFPANWVEIPRAEIDQATARLSTQTGTKTSAAYIMGAQRAGATYFTHPYALISHQPIRGLTLRDLVEANSREGAATQKMKELTARGFFSAFDLLDPAVARDRDAVVVPLSATTVEGVRVKALTVLFPCPQGVVQMHFYSTEATVASDFEEFFQAYQSLSFDKGHGYRPVGAFVQRVTDPSGKSSVIVAVIVGAILAGLYKHQSNRKKTKLGRP